MHLRERENFGDGLSSSLGPMYCTLEQDQSSWRSIPRYGCRLAGITICAPWFECQCTACGYKKRAIRNLGPEKTGQASLAEVLRLHEDKYKLHSEANHEIAFPEQSLQISAYF